MKRVILVMLIAAGFVSVSKAQEKKVGKKDAPPTSVSAAFNKAFPGSSNVKWEKEESDYEVGFMQNGKEMSAVYDTKGSLKETEVLMNVSELPQAAQDYVKKNYKNATVKEAAKITKADGEVVYEAEVNKKDLIFDTAGKFLKVQAE